MSIINKYIQDINKVIPLLEKDLVDNTIDKETQKGLGSMLFSYSLEKVVAQYSEELNKKIITQSLFETIVTFEEGFKWEGFAKSYVMYDQMIWMLSLGILCEIGDEDFKRIVAVIKRDGAQDKLIKTLVNYRLPNEIDGSSYIQKSPYAHLDALVTGKDKSSGFIKTYLDRKWYQGHKDAPWYDSHKRTKVNTYFGYWAWEAAALAKIYNVDDSSLTKQQYYPYRTVHW